MTPIICGPSSFWEEARWQGLCAACGKAGPWQAHHVLYKQVLDRLGIKGDELHDTRNALRLCTELGGNCHSRHHWKVRAVRTVELTDDNVMYVFEKLGLYGADWLRRYYDDTNADPRISRLESVLQEAA